MRKWLPRKKTVGIWVGAALIAVLAIPSSPFSPPSTTHSKHSGLPGQSYPHTGVIPTFSQIAMESAGSDGTAELNAAGTSDETSTSSTTGVFGASSASGEGGVFSASAAAQQAESKQVNSTQSSSSQGSKPVPGAKAAPGSKAPGSTPGSSGKSAKQAPGTTGQSGARTTPGTSGKSGASKNKLGADKPEAKLGPSPGAPNQSGTPGPVQGATPAPGTPAVPGTLNPVTPGIPAVPGAPGIVAPGQVPPNPFTNLPTAKLRIKVIDGRTLQPLPGAEVVIIETEQRVVTGNDGYTPYFDAPIIRNPRYRPLIQELHGQLGCIVYKNGYRDSIHLGIRVHDDGSQTETTVWMYKLGPGDTRIEPVLYQVPYHHLWLVELADRFRSKTQPGEGPERP